MTNSSAISYNLRLGSEAKTALLAQTFARHLQAEDVLLLSGGLAAGKTFFVRAAADALGSKDAVTSPTYTLVNLYRSPKGPIVHIDAYRLENSAAFSALALEDELESGIAFIEWGEMLADLFDHWVSLEMVPDSTDHSAREARLKAFGARGKLLLEKVIADFPEATA